MTGYPWQTGDALLASDLNAAIANAGVAGVANVLEYGAGIGGDDAAAIRAAIASGKGIILVPPGTYTMKSTMPTFGSATNPSCFEINNRHDTWISAYGAVFQIDNSISGPVPTTTLSFTNNSKNVGILGGTFVGNYSGLTGSEENVGINFCSVTAMTVRDVKFTGTFLASISGVFGFDSVFDNCQGFNNANAIDVAHLENVIFNRCRFEVNPAFRVTGINLHYDTPTLVDNVVTTEAGAARSLRGGITNKMRVFDCLFQGFANGIGIDAAQGIHISRTIIRDGLVASAPGPQAGILIYCGADAVSAGKATADIEISDCEIYGNGVTAVGGLGLGIHIGAAAGVIKNINILNNRIYDNTRAGVGTSALGASISEIFIAGNDFKSRSGGTLQTFAIDASLANAMWGGIGFAYDNAGTVAVGASEPPVYGNNTAVSWRDGSGAVQPIFSLSPSNATFMRPGSAPANIQFQNYAGATMLTVDSGANNLQAAVPLVLGSSLRVAGNAGFNNTDPIVKPTVTGAKGGNAALASLILALKNYGLVVDSTS